jgi:hypothetical protein
MGLHIGGIDLGMYPQDLHESSTFGGFRPLDILRPFCVSAFIVNIISSADFCVENWRAGMPSKRLSLLTSFHSKQCRLPMRGIVVRLNAPDIYKVATLCCQLIKPLVCFLLVFARFFLIDGGKGFFHVRSHLACISTNIDVSSILD